jgi:hypothetical protein
MEQVKDGQTVLNETYKFSESMSERKMCLTGNNGEALLRSRPARGHITTDEEEW